MAKRGSTELTLMRYYCSHVPGYFGIAFWKWSLVLPVHPRWGFVDTSVWADRGKGEHRRAGCEGL